ncbi:MULTISPECIES: helix-turn-helix domain-containing protein [Bacillus]|uniref:helix-turn-helix domain-containing protein n=1 Tax=Bacillus TaxID=1386 RepID=UPI0002E41D65|nr:MULTISPECIES: helix-turn-helix domain-containing protein [Bacillus]
MIKKNHYEYVAFDQLEIIQNEHKNIQFSRDWFNKIDNYLVLCIYEQVKFTEEMNGPISQTIPLDKSVHSNSFVIWDRTYKESEELFVNLRISSRNRVITWIANTIVSYLLEKYNNQQKASSRFKGNRYDPLHFEKYVDRMEQIIKAKTFLGEDAAWEEFCAWFQMYLTQWILEEMERVIGIEYMEKMSNQELNDVFYQLMTKNLSSNDVFIAKYTNIVNSYTTEWMNNIMTTMNLASFSSDDIESLLLISKPSNQDALPYSKNLIFSLGVEHHLHVMNNAPYQYVRESLYKNHFQVTQETPWPTTPLYKGNLEGVVQFRPIRQLKDIQSMIVEAQNQAQSLTDLDVDMFDALCSIFLSKARYTEDVIEIQFNDLLLIRGLKPKLGGEGRRGGYEQKQKEKVLQSLTKIQSLWLELNKAIVYEKGKPIQTQLQGRTFLFVDFNRKEYDISQLNNQKTFTFTVDKVFTKYLYGSGRQIALLPIQTLQYNPYRQTWEKRIARYFSWRWRTQARKGNFLQPNKIRTLLEAIGESINERTPSRTRDRLEKALDQLLEDGVVSAWHYHKWDESIVNNKGWVRMWLDSTILVEPPEVIKEQYRSIEKTKKSAHYSVDFQDITDHKTRGASIGDQLRKIRKQFHLSLLQVSEELEISPSYISHIERGLKTPSIKIQNRMMKWVQKFF